MFRNAIVRTPGNSVVNGSNESTEKPDVKRLQEQHQGYVESLKAMGVSVKVLPALEDYPDSTFVEDPVVMSTGKFAIYANLTESTRQGEDAYLKDAIDSVCVTNMIHRIQAPGLLDGADVMQVESTFYVGLSEGTNQAAFDQFARLVQQYDMEIVAVPVHDFAHLKDGVTYLSNNTMLVTGEFVDNPIFASFKQIVVPADEAYAVNAINNGLQVLMATGYPKTQQLLTDAGYDVTTTDMGEFAKMAAGMTRLSLRY